MSGLKIATIATAFIVFSASASFADCKWGDTSYTAGAVVCTGSNMATMCMQEGAWQSIPRSRPASFHPEVREMCAAGNSRAPTFPKQAPVILHRH